MEKILTVENISVSIIVPCRNERQHIEKFVENVLQQEPISEGNYELIVADGMSNDGTREILNDYVGRYPSLVMLDNPDQTTPHALNRAIKAARGDIIIRMDVHTEYAPDYIRQCVTTLFATGADNVGGSWHAVGKTYLQQAIALAFQSPFSSGGAGSHAVDYEGKIDTVYLGCWKKSTLENIGLFDEELVRNQDDELNLRIIRSGGRLWQSSKIRSLYYPRSSVTALFKQYVQYGYWKVRVIQKHRIPASVRHVIPGTFVATLLLLAVLSFFSRLAMLCLVIVVCLYGAANLAAAIITCRKRELVKYLPVMPIVFAAYHLGYGTGFLMGCMDFIVLRKGASHSFAKITRG